MFSADHSVYYSPPPSAPLFLPTADFSDPFTTASFDTSHLPRPSALSERQHSLPYPSTYPSVFPGDLTDVDGSIFDSSDVAAAVSGLDTDYIVRPSSPSTDSTSDESSTHSSSSRHSSSSASSAASSPMPLPDPQYSSWDGDQSPFQLPTSAASSTSYSTNSSSSSSSSSISTHQQPNQPVLTPQLLTSLSFDPQQLLAQLTTNLHTSPTPTEPKRRTRIPGLTAQQRAALKRQKHREIDTQRRHREQAAIGKLHALVYETETGKADKKRVKRMRGEWLDGEEREADEEEDDEDEEEGDDDDSSKKDKVTILEHSAKRMEQMRAIIHQLATACSTQQQNNRQLLSQLHNNNNNQQHQHQQQLSSFQLPYSNGSSPGLPHTLSLFHAPVAQQLDANLGQQSLYASMFLSASTAMFFIRCETGTIVDVNDRLLEESGWGRHHIINRLMTAPADALLCDEYNDEVLAMMEAAAPRVLVEENGEWITARKQEQYDRSLILAKKLYLGLVNQIDAVWRAQMRDGKVYELSCTSWVSGFTDVMTSKGRLERRPTTVVFACDTMNAVCISDND